MSSIFDLDAPIWVFMGEVADIIILALLWWICCLGIVTIGSSTTAIYSVFGKKARKETTYVAKDFFKSFKQNFRQSVPLSILVSIGFISFILYCSFIIEGVFVEVYASSLKYIVPITIVFAFELFNFTAYLWALLSRFDMTSRALMKTAMIMTHRHLLTTLGNLGVIGVVVCCIIKLPFVIIVAPSVIVWGQSFMIQNRFTTYIEEASREESKKLTKVQKDLEQEGINETEISDI